MLSDNFNVLKWPILTAMAIALGAALALGLARFAYTLFLPWMVEDLAWSYTLAGSMNMANAAGYFFGTLLTVWLFKHYRVAHALLIGAIAASILMGLSALTTGTASLLLLRGLSGIASAPVFIGGGVLVARLGSLHPTRSGLLIGIYYGGCGLGIVLSSWLVPLSVQWAQAHAVVHVWQPGWWWLALVGLLLTGLMAVPCLSIPSDSNSLSQRSDSSASQYLPLIAGYGFFGMGYIGYMTFVVALLKSTGMDPQTVNLFYAVLGVSVMVSARLWATMLDKYRGGETMALLNFLLAVSCLIPAVAAISSSGNSLGSFAVMAVFASGIVFGGCFLSAVASTTVFIKHNLPSNQWIAGITVFTSIFGAGQVFGPVMVGWIADQSNGLAWGLVLSSAVLLLGSLFAYRQKPLHGN